MAFYFFDPSPSQNMEGLVRLWSVALSLVNGIIELDRQTNVVSYWPAFVERTITLAAIVILRLSRSNIAPHLDLEAGEQAYFNVIKCMKIASLQPGDLRTRAAGILSKLWANQDIFKYPDGHVDSLRTRIRSRLSMSIVFDCFLWYKDTALDRLSPFQHEKYQDNSEPESVVPQTSVLASSQPAASQPPADTNPSTSGDGDVVMAAMPMTSMPMGIADDMNIDISNHFNDFSSPSGAGWMVPDYDWAANFEFSADTLPSVPWVMGVKNMGF